MMMEELLAEVFGAAATVVREGPEIVPHRPLE